MDYLIAGQRAPGSPKRTETLAGVNPPLDGPVVLLQDIIEVRHRSVPAARPKPLTSGRFSQGWPARLLRPALARRRPSIPPGLLRASTSRTSLGGNQRKASSTLKTWV